MTSPGPTLNYRIGLDISQLRAQMIAAGTMTAALSQQLNALQAQQLAHRAALQQGGQALVGFGVAVAAGLALSAREAIRWESAFAGVRKTVDGTPEEIDELEGSLRNLATTLPATHAEIAGVAEAAGQLGIRREDVASFTKTMIDMGESTNLSAEQAATEIAKMSNIMGIASSDADRLGSAIVALGNDGASTEADISAMALRLAGAGESAGVSAPAVLGLASALSSVGIEAESGGSSFSKVMIDIAGAVRNGGDSLDQFARVAGVSAEDFRRAYEEDASTGIVSFVNGLGQIQKSGGDTFGVLEQLGYTEIRVRDALLRSANAGDLLAQSVATGTAAWQENVALTDEANARYATTESQLKVARNAIIDTAISVGSVLLPAIAGAAEVLSNIARFFADLPAPVQTAITVLGVAAASVALIGGAALLAYPRVLALQASLLTMAAAGGASATAALAIGRIGTVLAGPVGIALAAATIGLGFWAAASGKASKDQQALRDHVQELSAALFENNGAITTNTRTLAANALATQDVGDSGTDMLSTFENIGISTQRATDGLAGNTAAAEETVAALDALILAGTTYDDQGFETISDKAKAAIGLREAYSGLTAATNENIESARRQAEASQETAGVQETSADRIAAALGMTKDEVVALGTAQDETADSAGDTTEVIDEQGQTAKETAEALEGLIKSLDELNGRYLNSREAQRGYAESLADNAQRLTDIAAGTEGYSAGLDINTQAGRDNAAALDTQAKAAGDLAEAIFNETGSEAAMRNSLQASRADLVATAQQFGMTEADAQAYADQVLQIPDQAVTDVLTPGSQRAQQELVNVLARIRDIPPGTEVNVDAITEGAQQKLRDVGIAVRTLPNGEVVATANTQQAIADLDRLTQPRTVRVTIQPGGSIFTGAGAARVQADGGVMRFFAGGGLTRESHVAQIAPAGAWRVWAEPETGGEGYIPLAPAKRQRSTAVLADIAGQFGYQLAPAGRPASYYAAGGISGGTAAGAHVVVHEHRVVVETSQTRVDEVARSYAVAAERRLSDALRSSGAFG